jgi:CelD/BcsL family acetyltransferase involved in cellulose biosynthesis
MLRTIRDLEELADLEEDWRFLAEARGNAFLTPEWFRCWFAEYGEEADPFVAALVGDDGSCRGLIPFALPRSGRPRVCRLAGANLADCFRPVTAPGEDSLVAAAAGRALGGVAGEWGIIALDRIEDPDGWVGPLAEATGLRLKRRSREAAGLPWIDLASHGDWEGYLASRSSHLRKRLRWLERRLARDHDVRVRRTETSETLAADVDALFELHDRRWQGESSLESPRARSFHAAFAAAALDRGWLRLWFLELDGEPVASWYGWRLGERYSFYNGGFDPSRSKLSPGLVLLARVVEAAFEEGAQIFDFLLGDESYKARFADRTREVHDLTLARSLPHPASALTAAEFGMRKAGRLVPASARKRLGLTRLGRRSLLGGRRR